MNPTRWQFEYFSLFYKKKKDLETASEFLKMLFGLNFTSPSKDDDGNYLEEQKPNWYPLAFWLQPEMFGNIAKELKQMEDMKSVESQEMTEESEVTDIDVMGFSNEEITKMNEIVKKEVERQAKILGIKTEQEIKEEEEEMEKERKPGVRIKNG